MLSHNFLDMTMILVTCRVPNCSQRLPMVRLGFPHQTNYFLTVFHTVMPTEITIVGRALVSYCLNTLNDLPYLELQYSKLVQYIFIVEILNHQKDFRVKKNKLYFPK